MRVPFPTLRSQFRSDFGPAVRIGTTYPSAPPKVVDERGPHAGAALLRQLSGSWLVQEAGIAR
jgi:hypothetical protein